MRGLPFAGIRLSTFAHRLVAIVYILAMIVSAIALVVVIIGALISAAHAYRLEPFDSPSNTPTVSILDDDVSDTGLLCDIAALEYLSDARLVLHAVNCTADRLFAAGFER